MHYLIHVNDDPTHAARGLDAARAYAKVAPDADHALHMPSHIFVQLGYWDDATKSNERAWPASRTRETSYAANGPNASWHTLNWLQYSYLQQGRWRNARALIDSARALLRNPPADYWGDSDARFVLSELLFRYASETGSGWADVAPAVKAQGSDTRSPRAVNSTGAANFHAAAAAVLAGDTIEAHNLVARIRARADDSAPAMRRARDQVLIGQLEGLMASSRGDSTAAIAAWQRASAAEEAIAPLGPPIMLVSHEWLGDLLLKSGKPAEAVGAYQKALERRPGRSRAMLSLARAQRAAGDEKAAAEWYKRVTQVWHAADADVKAQVRAQGQ